MKQITALLTLLVISLSPVLQAEDRFNTYGVFYDISYSGADAITIQQKTTSTKVAVFLKLKVFCTADCIIQVERDGTPATTTTQAIVAFSKNQPASSLAAFNASNVGSGTVIWKLYAVANTNYDFPLDGFKLPPGNQAGSAAAVSSVTFRITSGGSPVVRMLPTWYEENQ